MSILRRKLAEMMANPGKQKKFYCEVEYLESDGTAYIDTGLYRTNTALADGDDLTTYSFKGVVEFTSSGVRRLMGDNGADNGFWGVSAKDKWETGTASTYTMSINTKYKIDFTATATDMTLLAYTLDGTETCNFTRSATVPTKRATKTYKIFALTNATIDTRVYKYQIFIDNKIVGDYIPVLDWNMTPCMYDKVSGELLYNAADSGAFTYGREIHRVDWISSPNKNVCFNTDIYPQMDNFKIEVRAIKEANTSLFGSNTTNNFYDLTGSNGNNYAHYGASAGSFASFSLTDQNMPHTYMMENGNVYCDGVLKGSKTSESFTSAVPMGLFARIAYPNGTFNDSGNHTMYYTKIWNNGSLVRDYYPAIDETGKAFLFDKVSHQIFDNTGTGVVNYPPVEVEYLQSSGTQYIDTPATFKDTDTVEFKGALLTLTSDKFCMSPTTWNAGNNRFSMLGYYSPSLGVAFGSQGTPATVFVPNLVNTDVHIVRYEDRKFTMLDTGSVYNPTSAVTFANETDGIKMFYGYNAPTSCKFYYYKHWRDGIMKYNFVAALRNGVAGLYDKANNVFYQNNGTGTFTIGKVYESHYF